MKAGLLLLALAATTGGGRESIGTYGYWGAFTEADPARCYAIAQPVEAAGGRPFAAVGTWPSRGARNQIHVRLGHEHDPRARVTLSVGERRFDLSGTGADAWAPDARTDAAIVAAMRSGRSMSVETMSRTGQPFAEIYALHGAATAIDAAALACIGK